MESGINDIQSQLKILEARMNNIDLGEIRDSLTLLLLEAGKRNPEAIRQLNELSGQFANLGISLQNLSSFIDRHYPASSRRDPIMKDDEPCRRTVPDN